LWRCGDGLFFEVPLLASDTLLTTLHPLLENVLQTVDNLEISCLRAPFSWLEKPTNRMGRDLDCMACVLMGFHRSTFSKPNTEFNSDLALCVFWTFLTMKWSSEARNFEVINFLQHVFEKWVERCQRRYFEKETITATCTKFRLEIISESTNFVNGPRISVQVVVFRVMAPSNDMVSGGTMDL
jgi:hypothetical protein